MTDQNKPGVWHFKRVLLLLPLLLPLLLSLHLSLPLFSQNFHLNLGPSSVLFDNIHERRVAFYGFSIDYSYYVYKRAGIQLGYSHYFPATYYSLAGFWNFEEKELPVHLTGGANSFDGGIQFKIIDPPSKKILIYSSISGSYFMHKADYDKEPLIRHYGGFWLYEIKNNILSLKAGTGIIFKIGNVPLLVSVGYNHVIKQNESDNPFWDGYSVPFSSFWNIRAGISFPVMHGPTPTEIKMIEY